MNTNEYNKVIMTSDTMSDTFSITDTDIIQINSNVDTSTWTINSTLSTNIGLDTSTITLSDYNYSHNNFPLDVKGDANFQGDLKIQGKSLIETLEKIEEKLAILHPNEELEEKWENLRGLRKMYMDLEKEIIEKEKIWEILKR